MVEDVFLFKGNRICIPKHSIRELLVRKAHGGGLAGQFGMPKNLGGIEGTFLLT